MIVKKVKYTDTDKPKVWQIGDLVDYIRYPHNTNAQEKIAHAGSRNFFAATHNGQKVEMITFLHGTSGRVLGIVARRRETGSRYKHEHEG